MMYWKGLGGKGTVHVCVCVCGVTEEKTATCQNDWYADQYLNTIQCDHIVCNTEEFT
jgi:hypothetical protein